MRQSLARFSASVSSFHAPSWADFITTTLAFRFSVHTGFADRDRMRRAFLRAFGQPPQVIRRNARADVAA
jgi:hypothetical protein